MKFFFDAAVVLRETDAFLATRAATTSPLAKAQMFAQGLEWEEKVSKWRQQIQLRHETLLAESRDMNAAWNAAPPAGSSDRAATLPLSRLQEMCRQLSFLNRLSSQIEERRGRLAAD